MACRWDAPLGRPALSIQRLGDLEVTKPGFSKFSCSSECLLLRWVHYSVCVFSVPGKGTLLIMLGPS